MFRNEYTNSEASEIAIKGDHRRIELQRQGGQVGIVGEIAGRARICQEPRKEGSVPGRRLRRYHSRVSEPCVYHRHCFLGRERVFQNARVGADANESEQRHPRQTDHIRPRLQLMQQPGAAGVVMGELALTAYINTLVSTSSISGPGRA